MKSFLCGLAFSASFMTSAATADPIVTVDGKTYFLSHLTENCQSITNDPTAQIACFNAISQLLEQQNGGQLPPSDEQVTQSLDALRALAQYQDNDSGLIIAGASCKIHVVYYNNYFHISRRNISSIDLFSAQFDASKMQIDQTVQVQGTPLLRGTLETGASAIKRGGAALDSAQLGFASRSPGMALDAYAREVVAQLPVVEDQTFEFALIHPQRNQAGADIWGAFKTFVSTCRATQAPAGPITN